MVLSAFLSNKRRLSSSKKDDRSVSTAKTVTLQQILDGDVSTSSTLSSRSSDTNCGSRRTVRFDENVVEHGSPLSYKQVRDHLWIPRSEIRRNVREDQAHITTEDERKFQLMKVHTFNVLETQDLLASQPFGERAAAIAHACSFATSQSASTVSEADAEVSEDESSDGISI